MDDTTREEYERLKALGVPARRALKAAKEHVADPIPDDLKELDPDEGRIKIERGKFTVHVKVEYDRDLSPDDVGLGRFIDDEEEGAIKRPRPERGSCKYFLPDFKEAERAEQYVSQGMSKGAAATRARLEVLEDLRRAETMGEDWSPLVVIAKVYYKGIELCVDALGSVILSDRDDPYLFEVARDVVEEALGGAEKALKELQEEQEEQAPHTVEVTWLTGAEELDEENADGPGEYRFATKGEAKAFERGVSEAMAFADGWLDASGETKVRLTTPPEGE